MRRIVITPDDWSAVDLEYSLRLLDACVERLHLRTVNESPEKLRELITLFPESYRARLSIHEHLWLAAECGVGGVHLNQRSGPVPDGFCGVVSRSCHSIDELREYRNLDYLFLSPIADSISKPGYQAAFTEDELLAARDAGVLSSRVFALGGMTRSHEPWCRELGFGGIAMMGAAFRLVSPDRFKLQYITPDIEDDDLLVEQVHHVLNGGCRWVQLRLKSADASRIARVGACIAALCREYGATFLLDDHVELVETVGADGVHLGKNDMPVDQARRILGSGYIIGGTANTAEDILLHHKRGADYIGLGPLRFTTTKKNLAPTLGYEGYERIITEVRKAGVTLPVVGIGGVVASDLPHLYTAGVGGVAVCGAIDQFLANSEPRDEISKI